MRVAVIRPGEERVVVVEAPADHMERLDWMHRQIGVEEIDFTTLNRWPNFPRVQIVVDDLGLLREERPPLNSIATWIYNPPKVIPHPIVGTAILTGFDEEGETVDLPFAVLDDIARGLSVEVVQQP